MDRVDDDVHIDICVCCMMLGSWRCADGRGWERKKIEKPIPELQQIGEQ